MSNIPDESSRHSSLGTTLRAGDDTEAPSQPDNPIAAFAAFARAAGRKVPDHVNRTRSLRRGIRRLGLK